MKWITRERAKVDRIACPWLIKKFIDPQAGFIFVPAGQIEAKMRELGATPFDIEGCELGHHGEDVSFDSILKKYKLTDPALLLLAEIVRAADSHPSKPHRGKTTNPPPKPSHRSLSPSYRPSKTPSTTTHSSKPPSSSSRVKSSPELERGIHSNACKDSTHCATENRPPNKRRFETRVLLKRLTATKLDL